jgi:beta-N-acetylhexosaminidase
MRFGFLVFLVFILAQLCCCVQKTNFLEKNENAVPPAPSLDAGETHLIEARRIAQTLSTEELAGQLIMSGIDAAGALSDEEKRRLSDVRPGAIMLFRKNLNIDKELIQIETNDINALYSNVNDIKKIKNIKPFIAVDHEGGNVHRFGASVERLPSEYFYFELEKKEGRNDALLKIENDALRAAREIAALGINMNLAPVVELLNDDNKQFLQERSYGDDSEFVLAAARSFINGMREGGVSCVIKHFPGNSGDDPHTKRPVLKGTENDLNELAFPFYAVIKNASPCGVMVSHVIAGSWDKENNASLSEKVIQQKLLAESGFTGMVLADDFSMGAIDGMSPEEATVKAINAGCDMVMAWPANLRLIHTTLTEAIQSGAISRERALDAASKIIAQKIIYGIVRNEDAATAARSMTPKQ